MKNSYHQLQKTERQEIEILRSKKYSLRSIAKTMNRSVSTISRELSRNQVKGQYFAIKAHHKRYQRRYYCKKFLKKIREHPYLESFIRQKIQEDWSPRTIAKMWEKAPENLLQTTISHLTIYKYIYSDYAIGLTKFLYSQRVRPKKRNGKKTKRNLIPNRVWIDQRPDIVNQRERIGDVEVDFICSRKGDNTHILTMIDRQSRLLKAVKVPNRKPKKILKHLKIMTQEFSAKSATFDNDIGFTKHQQLNIHTYFCHPYSSWQKGQIEYANRMIRRYIPKKTLLKNISQAHIDIIVHKINHTPRECLNYKTPQQLFSCLALDPKI
jgi:IS30 family transposase